MNKTQPEETSELIEPRVVPLPLRIKILTGREMQAVFFMIALLSVYANQFQICGPLTRSLVLQYCPTRSVQGRLLPWCSSNPRFTTRIDGVRHTIYRHAFSYVVNGRTFYGRCYSISRVDSMRDATVYYSPLFPQCSKVAGMRAIWGRAIVWYPTIGVAVVLLIIFLVLPNRIRAIRALRTGQLTTARVCKREEYRDDTTRRVRYEFRYKADDGLYYRTKFIENAYSCAALEDEANEPLIYDPKRPKVAFVLDSIPGRPRIDEDGVVRDIESWTTPFLLIIPVVAIVTFYHCVKSVVELLV